MSKAIYVCPLESTGFPLCKGCPFFTEEQGKLWCHCASLNFAYEKESKSGVYPLIYPSEVHCAELRYAEQDGQTVVQMNFDDLAGTKETAQVPVSDLLSAIVTDALPKFRRKGGKRK